VFERVIYERLLQNIKINILLTGQFGFRPHTSMEKASYRLSDEILKVLNNRSMVEGI
jgi:hypothetical protein